MNSYLFTDYSAKTHKKICRKIIKRLALSFASCLDSKLEYTGLGSLTYEDFKELYPSGCIGNMTSIEIMHDRYGVFDEMKYRRFMLNRPYESIRLLPMSVREALKELTFDRNFLIWLDYDSSIKLETIEETAEVIHKASKSGMIICTTGTLIVSPYTGKEKRTLDMDAIRKNFADMAGPENEHILESLTWENFSSSIRDLITPYYQRLVSEKNIRENRNFALLPVGRIEYRQPSMMISDIWLLVDRDEVDTKTIVRKVMDSCDAGYHRLDMPFITERERAIIGSRLYDDPAVLADELALDTESVRKYIRYWDDYIA